MRGDARRVNLHRFPYQLWYRVDEKAAAIVVIAVLHHKRDSTDYGDLID
ncbi:MAG: type II toxin-antitoxin system RelE/ParE family toxin [Cryobacterium sp.]|nr:type II toxin-antitoxin system RelE/ParE family toxin [Cryobacterium sp.]